MATAAHTNVRSAAPHHHGARTRKLIALDSVRNRLVLVWLIGAGSVVTILVFQSLLHHFGSRTQEAWGWLLPTIMPTLGMIVTVLSYTALDPISSKTVVRRDFFLVAISLSIVYLTLILITVLIGPFAAGSGPEMVALMQTSNLWLGPLQGLVASALGVLFVTKQKHGDGST